MTERSYESDQLLPPDVENVEHQSRPSKSWQMLAILIIMLCEPMTANTIFPFVAKLINEVGVTKGDEAATGYYVGIIESLFFFAQGVCVLQWGKLSDHVGRRRVLLFGLLGLCVSMVSFGLSRSFTGLVLSRALAGMLNGNIGVAKTMMAELTDESNRAFAFSMFPVAWIAGSTIAPLIGGGLQHPAERYPALFGQSQFWKTFPYFLPCSTAALFSAAAFVISTICLQETLPLCTSSQSAKSYQSMEHSLDSNHLPGRDAEKEISVRAVMTKEVMIAITNYSCLAILEISYISLLTLFLAVPISSGGLGLSPPKIGVILALLGLVSGTIQVVVFPWLHRRWGPKKLLTAALSSFCLIFPAFPLMHTMALASGHADGTISPCALAVLIAMVPCCAMVDMGFSCVFMYITAACPSPSLLGTTNGLAQTLISFTRALGPAGATFMFSFSVEHQVCGGYGAFWFFTVLAIAAMGCASLLPDTID